MFELDVMLNNGRSDDSLDNLIEEAVQNEIFEKQYLREDYSFIDGNNILNENIIPIKDKKKIIDKYLNKDKIKTIKNSIEKTGGEVCTSASQVTKYYKDNIKKAFEVSYKDVTLNYENVNGACCLFINNKHRYLTASVLFNKKNKKGEIITFSRIVYCYVKIGDSIEATFRNYNHLFKYILDAIKGKIKKKE